MPGRRSPQHQCALCGGPRRSPSTASVHCGSCGAGVCIRHAVEAPDSGGWICKRCDRRRAGKGT